MRPLTGLELAESFRQGRKSPVDAIEECLEKIRNNPDQAIFISLTEERALLEARASAERYKAGKALSALDGVPVSWKDLIDIEGTITTAGSETRRSAPVARADAPIVKQAAKAGLVTVGKVNLSEFAYSAIGHNPHFGTPRNPFDATTHRIPGGSSSGSAVSVAAGLVPISIGTDTGGSIRIPAAFNGLVGFKPSEGSVETTGVFALSQTLDTIGPLANSVGDCRAVLRVLRNANQFEADVTRSQPIDAASISIVAPTHTILDGAEPEVVAAFENALESLGHAGIRIVRKPLPALAGAADLLSRHGSLAAIEAYHRHRDFLRGADASRLDPLVLRRLLDARDASAYDLLEISRRRAQLAIQFASELGGAAVAAPTVRTVAPPLASLTHDFEFMKYVNARTSANTVLINILRGCSVTVPIHVRSGRLPVGMMLSRPFKCDDSLEAMSQTIEEAI